MQHISRQLAHQLFPIYAICGVFTVLYVPYRFPMPPSVSFSYLFGYNNRVGVATLLLVVAAGAFWTRGPNVKVIVNAQRRTGPIGHLWISASIDTSSLQALALKKRRL